MRKGNATLWIVAIVATALLLSLASQDCLANDPSVVADELRLEQGKTAALAKAKKTTFLTDAVPIEEAVEALNVMAGEGIKIVHAVAESELIFDGDGGISIELRDASVYRIVTEICKQGGAKVVYGDEAIVIYR